MFWKFFKKSINTVSTDIDDVLDDLIFPFSIPEDNHGVSNNNAARPIIEKMSNERLLSESDYYMGAFTPIVFPDDLNELDVSFDDFQTVMDGYAVKVDIKSIP